VIKVTIKYEWEFNKKEWDEQIIHMKGLENDINIKVNYDPVSTFHHLNDLAFPQASEMKVTKS